MNDVLKKVYVITSGSYSDYGIVMICDTRESAEKAVELYDKSSTSSMEFDIEEWNMNTRKPEDMYPCWMWYYNLETNILERFDRYGYHETAIVNYVESKKLLIGYVLAKNEEVAKKIIYDLVAQKKAELAEIM
jgi:hypothetical protein